MKQTKPKEKQLIQGKNPTDFKSKKHKYKHWFER